jgi:hypothetical protein
MNSKRIGRDNSAPGSHEVIRQMFTEGLAREKRLLSPDFTKQFVASWTDNLFYRPLFWPDVMPEDVNGLSSSEFDELFGPAINPYTFSVTRSADDKSFVSEWRYGKLLELLRGQKDRKFRWLIMARWLKQEQVCQPDAFLPKSILQELTRKYFASKRLSPANLVYWSIVTGWKPYFRSLRSELKKARKEHKDPRSTLEAMGYESTAVNCAINKRQLISTIIDWVAKRNHFEAANLANAYSKIKSPHLANLK